MELSVSLYFAPSISPSQQKYVDERLSLGE